MRVRHARESDVYHVIYVPPCFVLYASVKLIRNWSCYATGCYSSCYEEKDKIKVRLLLTTQNLCEWVHYERNKDDLKAGVFPGVSLIF